MENQLTGDASLSDLVAEYKRVRGVKESTVSILSDAVGQWNKRMGPIAIKDLDDAKMDEFIAKLKEWVAPSTVTMYSESITRLMMFAGPKARRNRQGVGIVSHLLGKTNHRPVVERAARYSEIRRVVKAIEARGYAITNCQAAVALASLRVGVSETIRYVEMALQDPVVAAAHQPASSE